jgi:hypothetical protein
MVHSGAEVKIVDFGHSQVRKPPTKLAQKLGQLQPFIAVFPQEHMSQLVSFGPT